MALALAVALSGGLQALAAEGEPEHRCHCPAGSHACACLRCAAKAAARKAASPPCHGGGAGCARTKARTPAPPGAPCVGGTCGETAAGALLAAERAPFVVERDGDPLPSCPGEPLRAAPALATGRDDAPEPPPPRA